MKINGAKQLQRGSLIVFEGCDRSGKTTQVKRLVDNLNKEGISSKMMRFPDRTTAIGSIINQYLTCTKELDDHAIHLLFSANRWELVPEIKSSLDNGTTVIIDRYAFSGVAFSAAKPGLSLAWCKQPDVGLPRPDLVCFLDVSEALCGRKFELKFNDVRFVGHPLSLDGNDSKRSPITMFHVVFALKAVAPYSVVECYHELSQRLGLAVMHEEKRVSYLSSQTKCLISAQDEVAAFAEADQEHPFSRAVDRSELAKDIKQIHEDLCSTGVVNRYINKWVEVAFCLPQKVHRRNFPNLMVEPESIFQCLEALRPYHALLLRVDENELLESL